MRATFLYLLMAAGFFWIWNHKPVDDPLLEGLVAHYTFNHCDARDDSGNGSDGVLYGDIQCWCGIEDDGLLFDGDNDYIEFQGAVNDYFTTTDFTVSFYFKPEKYSTFSQSLLSKKETCTDYLMLDILLDWQKRKVETQVYESPAKYYPKISPSLDSTGWIHYALVRDGFEATTYINGQKREHGFRCSGVDISNSAPLSFANSPCITGGRATRFRGVLDELRIYDKALTEQEIAELYSRYPVENAKQDCFALQTWPGIHLSDYLCSR